MSEKNAELGRRVVGRLGNTRSAQGWSTVGETARFTFACIERNGKIVSCGRTFSGVSPERVVGHFVFDFVPTSEQQPFRAALDRVFGAGEPTRYTSPIVDNEGNEWLVEAWLNPLVVDGRVQAASLLAFDVAGQQALIDTLRQTDDIYRSLVENAGAAITYCDPSGTILFVNSAGVQNLGKPAVDLIGSNVYALLPGLAEVTRRRFRQIVESKSGAVFEDRIELPDGPRFFVSYMQPVTDESGQVFAIQIASHENTELVETREARTAAEEQLLQAQKMESLGMLASGIAHEMNNLLTGILGLATLVERETPPNDSCASYVRQIISSCWRGASLTNDFLGFARHRKTHPELFSPNRTAREVHCLLERTAAKNATLQLELASELWPVRSDSGQLALALMNLCINSLDAVNEDGRIRVTTRNWTVSAAHLADFPELSTGPHIELAVADNGTGMSPETQQRAREPFFTTKPAGKGTGLGLSTVDTVVRNCGGAIRIHSRVGEGTTVRLVIPAIAATETERAVARGRTADAMPASRRATGTILLVDDEALIRLANQTYLQQLGHEVVLAVDGRQGLEIFGSDPDRFDLVVLDSKMPVMGGRECLARLIKINPEIPVLVCSGFTNGCWSDSPAAANIVGMVRKPFAPEHLADLVERVLSEAAK